MKALLAIQLCAREYSDVGYTRVGRDATSAPVTNGPNWLDWLNDAQRAVVLVRPDAGAVTQTVQLIAGTKQAAPSGTVRILKAVRNMGADGLTPGKTVRFVDHEAKGDTNRDWHTEANGTVVREVIYDDKKDPLTFYVSPPAIGKYLELTLSKSRP